MRPKIAEFQARLKGLILGHGTVWANVPSIVEKGLTNDYNYCCVLEGWPMEKEYWDVLISADVVADRTYPDPEGQWGDNIYSMSDAVEKQGLEAVLDELERCLGTSMMLDFGDATDPNNWNLVIVGPVPPEAILGVKKGENG
jgi:hypothetical protein